jgi:hypothetical protein
MNQLVSTFPLQERHDKMWRWMERNKDTLRRIEDAIYDYHYRHLVSDHDLTLVNVGLWKDSEGPPHATAAFAPWGKLMNDARVPMGFVILLGPKDRFIALLPLD